MLSWGSRYIYSASAVAFVWAWIYGLTTGGSLVGVLSVGYKGGVGDQFGYGVLLGVGAVLALLGLVITLSRDGDVEDLAAMVGATSPPSLPPIANSAWGPVTAFSLGCLILGLSTSSAFLYFGLALVSVVAVFWAIDIWSDHATGDREVNRILRDRAAAPLQVPVFAGLGIAAVVIGISRVLLAVPATGSVVVASLAALFVFLSAVAFAKLSVSRSVMTAVVFVGAVAILVGGIVAAAVGPREHHSEDDHAIASVVDQ